MQLVSSHLPRWLEVLFTEKFFNGCIIHEEERKNEKNIYCLDCCTSLCPHCLSLHGSHRLLQIRRYVYQDVIRLDDAAKLVDCDYVQPYINNGAKVIFLNQRPQSRTRSSGNICSTCDRSLQDSYLFCCLSCKIDYLIRIEGGLSKFFFECNFLPLPESSFENGLMTPDSILEPVGPTRTSSGSDGYGGALASCDTIKIVKKKRSSITACRSVCSPVPEMSVGLMNRRKKTPQRAPLY
ncbi:b box-type domain-containing protein [Citrus sinensis]|uniref:B box-type domain-containing protein n=2 Tax=Citrus TaxID=2706 RepID=A0ACB8MRU6_CITSI|nr:uncharacterized protein LOC18048049 isoform X1 [Citrus x clementina]XP_006491453.1 protein RGF1 INDUCIBLE TRANSCRIPTION FACTOR 1 isoform X1 [Citrus sinensis]GAY41934.1 hypothetical protein CUMW_063140 [Citrus unshiu]ESR58544.1 hypothetical protein CICLE_v10021990mg [Citrus x clementina]KAH9733177.1 b box-type domain-containing protein [Citrus sinensis]KAH9788400.1 b box-type domain-containing protein [Citrus sinensis]